MTYDKPNKPGWYWAATTRGTKFNVAPCNVYEDNGALCYRWLIGGEDTGNYDRKEVSDAPSHLVWGQRIEEPRFSINPKWEP